jgi:hypothetical protein
MSRASFNPPACNLACGPGLSVIRVFACDENRVGPPNFPQLSYVLWVYAIWDSGSILSIADYGGALWTLIMSIRLLSKTTGN